MLKNRDLTIAAIGPATNIANLVEFYPNAAENIKDLVFCAGRSRGTVFTTDDSPVVFPDYNFEMNPASLKKVIESDIPITFSGYEASSSISLYQDDLDKIKQSERPGDKWVYQQLQPWITKWRQELDIKGFIPFDCSTLGHLFYPDYFEYHNDIPVATDVRSNDSKAFSVAAEKPYLEVSYNFNTSHTVDFAYKAKPGYKDIG